MSIEPYRESDVPSSRLANQIVAIECNAIDQCPSLGRVSMSTFTVAQWADAGFLDFGDAWPRLFGAAAAHGLDHAMIQQTIAHGRAAGRRCPILLDDDERQRLVEAAKRGQVTYGEAAPDRARALMVPVVAKLAESAAIADEIDGGNRAAFVEEFAPSVIHGRRAYRADDDAGACEAWALH